MRLDHKIAIVTGAASGFGAGISRRYAQESARVVVNDVNETGADRVVAEIRSAGGHAAACAGDVSVDADVARLVQFALTKFGGLDVVVNNAGTTHRNQPMLDVPEEFRSHLRVNVKVPPTAGTPFRTFVRSATARSSRLRRPPASATPRIDVVQRKQGCGDRHVTVDGRGARA
jgi:NAD(P)-dependent dehydrogenase (short-subunit alcohol dehydrogenase family)